MNKRQAWVQHKFHVGIDEGWATNILARLGDTPVRLLHHAQNLSDEQLSQKEGDAWSIKEHIGHLTDLEDLNTNRLIQFAQLKPELIAADMSNAKTNIADHNATSIAELLKNFSEVRKKLLSTYASLPERSIGHQALHPRLQEMMKPVDVLFFAAEHDDHHIATIIELKKQFNK